MDYAAIEKLKKDRNISKILIFGTGSYWKNIMGYINNLLVEKLTDAVDFFIDNDRSVWGTEIDGIRVVDPKSVSDTKDESFILIASSFYDEISRQLMHMGLIEDYHFTKDIYVFCEIANDVSLKRRIIPFKDIHKGKRAFIVGNGPSLRISDLDRLKNEITFGCNKIYLAFDQTDWRPTYFAAIDSVFIEDCAESIKAIECKKFLDIEAFRIFGGFIDDIVYLKHIGPGCIEDKIEYGFPVDIANGIYGGWTVVYTNLQIAFYMGITEVYLLGVDFNYKIPNPTGELSKYGEVILRGGHEMNHFHKNYRKEGERWTLPQLDKQYKAFLCAKKTFDDNNRRIYNASRETELDIFPLVNFDSIID